MAEHGDKISEDEKKTVEEAIAKLKTTLEGDDNEAIKTDMEALQQAAHKLAEAIYKDAQAAEAQQQGGDNAQASGNDGAVDADFEVVEDEKK